MLPLRGYANNLLILNPSDDRAYAWDMVEDLTRGRDAVAVATILPSEKRSSGGNGEFFDNAVGRVLSSITIATLIRFRLTLRAFAMTPNSIEQLREEIVTDPFFGDAVEFILCKLGDVRNKVILDSGCGVGRMSVFFAIQGAKVIGIDKNGERIDAAKSLADSFGVKNSCLFLQECSEETTIDSGSIDIIFSKSTIQYMDQEKVLNEYVRILKPGGSIALVENLPFNPFINLYRFNRWLSARTDEQQREYINSIRGYITFRDISRLGTNFGFVERHDYHLFRMMSIYLRSLRSNFLTKRLDNLFSGIDKILLSLIPFLRKYAWFTAVYFNDKHIDIH